MGIKALTNDKKLAKLIYKSVIKSANKKYPADVRLDVMLEFIDSLKVTLEGLIKKQAEKEAKEDRVSIPTVDITKFDGPAQLLAEEAEIIDEEPDSKTANKMEATATSSSTRKDKGAPLPKKSKTNSKKKSKK